MDYGMMCWHELMTPDASKAKDFYRAFLDYGFIENDMGEFTYHMFTVPGEPESNEHALAGMMEMQGPQFEGVPPHWIGYILVEDLDATQAKIEGLGGKVLHGPQEVPEMGRFTIFSDPSGAVVALWQSKEDPTQYPNPDLMQQGRISWSELNTRTPEASLEFFKALLGCGVFEMDMGEQGMYYMLTKPGKDPTPEHAAFGLMAMVGPQWPEEVPSHWMSYITVKDIEASTKKIAECGGNVCMGPIDIPNIGKFTIYSDPTGATISIFQHMHPENCTQ